ncbi:hypothetical protein E3N88_34547 [Mikania micrantha]|uniref:Uncharacterized protein n=1 Tax=Mikania micrantha TaxID=192012 RepID=A0A5N6LYF7_9ASTR|nr:hypothetical protein E3N88_34547 [Mikania micrantha]
MVDGSLDFKIFGIKLKDSSLVTYGSLELDDAVFEDMDHRSVISTFRRSDGLCTRVAFLRNLLDFKEKKPYKKFEKWAETYGLIYSIKTEATSMLAINSNEITKEDFVTRFNSISTRKLAKELNIFIADKTTVAMSDYEDYHKTVKHNIHSSFLGPAAMLIGACHSLITILQCLMGRSMLL